MADSDIPAFADDDEDDGEATMMWNREDFETDGELPPASELKAIHPPAPTRSESKNLLDTGLDENDLFSDVLDEAARAEVAQVASMPVQPLIGSAGAPRIEAVDRVHASDGEEIEAPKVPSLVAPAPPSRVGLWVGLSAVVLLGAAAGAYVFRAHLGPLGAWLDVLGLPF